VKPAKHIYRENHAPRGLTLFMGRRRKKRRQKKTATAGERHRNGAARQASEKENERSVNEREKGREASEASSWLEKK